MTDINKKLFKDIIYLILSIFVLNTFSILFGIKIIYNIININKYLLIFGIIMSFCLYVYCLIRIIMIYFIKKGDDNYG